MRVHLPNKWVPPKKYTGPLNTHSKLYYRKRQREKEREGERDTEREREIQRERDRKTESSGSWLV